MEPVKNVPECLPVNFTYVAVKASLYASDSSVFGLDEAETKALVKKFSNYQKPVINGILLKAAPMEVVNALSQLGYRVVATTGEAEIVWTMQREIL
ncbi:unnamed protein product [Acanthoscelides obtectus]|uniref:GTP cyclohydrolase 1 feedback regulatory protein n=1 Tax=Acanthoscelides obtectus TaxID=200917 RepID=A0A9P0JNK2_ACAOB|nr:unnamed protein product [Acanthoscelides obtectus]CAK1634600.1 hypothetical protein AOBTE_LOCUS8825 [Acanthoscelides obtectus]